MQPLPLHAVLRFSAAGASGARRHGLVPTGSDGVAIDKRAP
jgi:hypothetical protein